MRLTDASVAIRPRSAWEALDLGVLLARRHAGLLMASWALVTLPVFAVLSLLLWDYSSLAILIFWWLKPAFERLPLYILSRALFADTPTLREALRAFPGLPHALHRARSLHLYAGRRALVQQHPHDQLGGFVAEQLPELLLVVGNAVLLDHRDVEPGARAVERGGIAGRATTDDDEVEVLGRGDHLQSRPEPIGAARRPGTNRRCHATAAATGTPPTWR